MSCNWESDFATCEYLQETGEGEPFEVPKDSVCDRWIG